MMSRADPPPDARVHFTEILDRMQLLRDDFTSHADDHDVIRALAGAPGMAPDPAADVLPDEYCLQLDVPLGTTYAAAARKLGEVLDLKPSPETD
jgi:hypothetical protein